MKNLSKYFVDYNTKLSKLLKIINSNEIKFLIVVNEKKNLLGTVTDGDIRRAILKEIDLNLPVSLIMNKNPITANINLPRKDLIKLMKTHTIQHLPLLDEQHCVVDLAFFDKLINPTLKKNPVFIMAGGLGKRLRPLTKYVPKPMLLIGNKPILERMLELLIDQGFHDFYFSVNFKGNLIENYFGNGSKWDVNITYISEHEKMGTAGSLSLIRKSFLNDILVLNGDLFTDMNFLKLLDFHKNSHSDATMVVTEKEFEIPYGVITSKNKRISKISEKPKIKFQINSGIYVLSPKILEKIPKKFIDMPIFFDNMIKQKMNINAYLSNELWIDIGNVNDFKKTKKLF